MDKVAEGAVVDVVASEVPTESSDAIRAGYDRIANPEQVNDEKPKDEPAPTAEMPPAAIINEDQIKDLMAQVSRIQELEKRLRDEGGRYGALKQTIEQLQQRIAAPSPTNGGEVEQGDIDEILKEVKESFGEDELYRSLKHAFSKVVGGKAIDPGSIEKIVADRIEAVRQEELRDAQQRLSEEHPNWAEDRETPEFKEWMGSIPERERVRLMRSKDPAYVAEKLDGFVAWKAKRAEAPPPNNPTAPASEKPPAAPSKRLANAVLPTNGSKPPSKGDDPKASIRAGYERVAAARHR